MTITPGLSPFIPRPGSASKSDSVYLYPGKLHVAATPVTITTILGSCVAVGLWDATLEIGGMNHFMLPFGGAPTPKFGNHALPMLLEALIALGVRQDHLRAGLFGGSVLAQRDHFQLGPRNLEAAWSFLDEHSIPVAYERTGGDRGRKIRFETSDGSSTVREL